MDHVRITGVLLLAFLLSYFGAYRGLPRDHFFLPRAPAARVFLLGVTLLFATWFAAGLMLLLRKSGPLHATAFFFGQAGMARGVGLLLFLAGNVLLHWTRRTLGRNLQVAATAPLAGNVLVVSGPYRLVRHPLYLAILLIGTGLAFIVGSWIFFVWTAIAALALPFVIGTEERQLRDAFGSAWDAYAAGARRLLPGIW